MIQLRIAEVELHGYSERKYGVSNDFSVEDIHTYNDDDYVTFTKVDGTPVMFMKSMVVSINVYDEQ